MEILTITNVCRLFFHLEDMIDVDNFSTRYVVDTIQEWFQVQCFSIDNLNNFNIIAGIQNFTVFLKIRDTLLLVHHIKAVKYAVTLIICVDHDIYMQSICPK